MKRRRTLQLGSGLLVSGFAGCAAPSPSRSIISKEVGKTAVPIHTDSPTELKKLPYDRWPQYFDEPYSADEAEKLSIQKYSYGGDTGIHPLLNSRSLLRLSENIRQSKDKIFSESAHRLATEFIDSAHVSADDSLYFPYQFDYDGHGSRIAPWYSGMAQGVALSAFTRLFKQTGNEDYIEYANRTLRSLFPISEPTEEPWVAIVSDDHYWIEEYPEQPLDHTLNGKIFAMFGLYEYWLVTGDENAKNLLQAALSTIDRTIQDFRIHGGVSYYCLKHRGKHDRYHDIHIRQLEKLSDMTEGDRFDTMASKFRSDVQD